MLHNRMYLTLNLKDYPLPALARKTKKDENFTISKSSYFRLKGSERLTSELTN